MFDTVRVWAWILVEWTARIYLLGVVFELVRHAVPWLPDMVAFCAVGIIGAVLERHGMLSLMNPTRLWNTLRRSIDRPGYTHVLSILPERDVCQWTRRPLAARVHLRPIGKHADDEDVTTVACDMWHMRVDTDTVGIPVFLLDPIRTATNYGHTLIARPSKY